MSVKIRALMAVAILAVGALLVGLLYPKPVTEISVETLDKLLETTGRTPSQILTTVEVSDASAVCFCTTSNFGDDTQPGDELTVVLLFKNGDTYQFAGEYHMRTDELDLNSHQYLDFEECVNPREDTVVYFSCFYDQGESSVVIHGQQTPIHVLTTQYAGKEYTIGYWVRELPRSNKIVIE